MTDNAGDTDRLDDYYDGDYDPDAVYCETCGREVTGGILNDEGECYDCSGLSRCPDDICHGNGRCMHGDADDDDPIAHVTVECGVCDWSSEEVADLADIADVELRAEEALRAHWRSGECEHYDSAAGGDS